MTKHVVVIGGGYGGLRAIEFLHKYEDVHVTLIDKNPYHYLQTEAYGYIAGRFDLHDVAINLSSWCTGFKDRVNFIHEEVKLIDFEKQSVSLNKTDIFYDYLIIATGAETNFFSFIDGLKEHSLGIKDLQRAHSFRQKFEDLIYKKLLATKESDEDEINIVIGGAGLSGVEVAAEMAHVIQVHTKTIGEAAKDLKIYLIDASDTILPGMGKYTITNTHKRLEKLDIKILTNTFINNLDESFIYFKDAQKLKYSFMVFTGGIKASTLNSSIESEKNKVDQFIPDSQLNIQGKKNVFALGDCVEIKDNNGNILPPTAQIAEKSAEYAAKTIRQRIDGHKSKPFNGKVEGVFVALGGNYAVGEMFGFIKVKGYKAYLLKKAITSAYHFGLRLRINTGFKNRIKN
ncbi:MAG: FAD-dependent oxidoreductase [Sulfurimonas sp.]|uniref:NAD(P)/FAD-dependent oxidoreductase n=1 Tax=Sulfurimonas sp. TaxID=2022749 RepID=UPI00262558F5|nr:FAD-dependent oxidoreductase [Sulfurimonas sp.]MCW8895662.1 FAD-dependent oxidoreductase [Sulfurimonas sp.]MCW8955183.1 FAD-dependent oxidoreductase [Sulfurimonas sp.]MCW9066904.1 FAD-dependent oxidoreductase [Sulfurimonas sp.]